MLIGDIKDGKKHQLARRSHASSSKLNPIRAGPRVRTLIGRKDSSKANMDGLPPDVNGSADQLISLFRAKSISHQGCYEVPERCCTGERSKDKG